MPASEQEWQIAAWERENEKCPRCGQPRSECADGDRLWFPQRTVCYADAEARAAERLYDLLHEAEPFHDGTFTSWVEKPSRSHPYHYKDGVTVWASTTDLSPDDKFTTDADARPAKPERR